MAGHGWPESGLRDRVQPIDHADGVRRHPIPALAVVVLLVTAGLASPAAAGDDALELLTIETAAGVHTVMVEVADTAEERGVGLMHRTGLAPDRGNALRLRQDPPSHHVDEEHPHFP